MGQKTQADRLEVIRDLLGLALPLADTVDSMLAACICNSLHRADQLGVQAPIVVHTVASCRID